jgi:multicomponent Na+:H+ antiporter subunit G
MNVIEWISAVLVVAGLGFFLAGTVGLLRFPDVFTRLHALSKADNVGLGFLIAGLALQADSWATVARLGLIWLLVLVASATVSFLVARAALQSGQRPWRAP